MIQTIPYQADGYLDMGKILPHVLPFTWMWGGRGIGKTYGVLKDARLDNPRLFVLMRRTQKQADMVYKPLLHPFRSIDRDCGIHTAIVKDGDIGIFYDGVEGEDGAVIPQGPPLGYVLALSTLHNIRGIDMSDVQLLIYDEFIPQKNERNVIRDEYGAFQNAYETINRNRELKGEPPLQLIGLTNSNTLGNPYFLGMGVIRVVDNMIKHNREVWADEARGLMLINILRSPISEKKKNTALYKLSNGEDDYTKMSLGNDFALDYCTNPGTFPLREVRPVVSVGEICIYKHKAKTVFYCASHISGSPQRYGADEGELLRFRRDWWMLWAAYMDREVVFQDIMCEILFKKYFS